jgi:hypothetical protein
LPLRRLPVRLRLETLRRLWRLWRLLLVMGTLRRLLTARSEIRPIPSFWPGLARPGQYCYRPRPKGANSADDEVSTLRIDKRRRAG